VQIGVHPTRGSSTIAPLLVPGSAADVMSVTVLLRIGALGDGTLGTAIRSKVVATDMAFVVIVGVVLAVVIVFCLVLMPVWCRRAATTTCAFWPVRWWH